MIKKWKTISSEYIYMHRPWGVLRKDHVQTSSGFDIPNYYVLEYPDWVNVLGITTDNQIVLIKQYRHALGVIAFELPAGVIDEGEEPLVAAKREMLEETGYGNGEWKAYMQLCANPATHTNLTHCFIATGLEKVQEQELENSEEIEVQLFELADVKQILLNNEMPQALQAAALWRFIAEMA